MDKSTLLGSGTYGKVYKMNINGRDVAVKFIENDEDGMRELGEVNLLKKFDHPNILKRFDELFVLPNEIGITLPLANGDLERAIRVGVSADKKERWVYEMLSAVHCIHKNGYYHCDIKPANVLIISDNAVIADPGLMGLQILEGSTCQSIVNPQLLYNHSNGLKKTKMTNPVYRKSFTNAQSDLWALGETIYYVANRDYAISTDISRMNAYIETNKLPIEGEFNRIIKTLMNPDPEELNINLTILLAEEPFNGKYSDYISGTVNNDIPNKNPVIFTRALKEWFEIEFEWLLKSDDNLEIDNYIIFYNAIDMFYRVFNIIPDPKRQMSVFIWACFTLSGKIYGQDIDLTDIMDLNEQTDDPFTEDELFATEKVIVEFLGGVLDRDLPIFYGVSFEKFKTWISANPEKYEQFNMAGLVREINA